MSKNAISRECVVVVGDFIESDVLGALTATSKKLEGCCLRCEVAGALGVFELTVYVQAPGRSIVGAYNVVGLSEDHVGTEQGALIGRG